MDILRQFKGVCRGLTVSYTLYKTPDEWVLEATTIELGTQTLSWHINDCGLNELNQLCEYMISRK